MVMVMVVVLLVEMEEMQTMQRQRRIPHGLRQGQGQGGEQSPSSILLPRARTRVLVRWS